MLTFLSHFALALAQLLQAMAIRAPLSMTEQSAADGTPGACS